MIDLPAARALAARARENTSDGLEARELLADAVEELCDRLDGITAKDILITGGRILAVQEVDWQDMNEDGQTWTVYTELNSDD